MTTSWETICSVMESRRAERGPLLNMMLQVRDRYGADYVLPDPSGMTDDPSPMLTPALIAEAIDQPALRAASVLPNVYVPALKPEKSQGAGSRKFASSRRGAVLAAWYTSRLPLLLRRAFRHLRAYDAACFVVSADMDNGMPLIELRDPLSAFPEPRAPEDLSLPSNAGFLSGKSADWIRARWPHACSENGGPIPRSGGTAMDSLYDIVEWIDEEEVVFGVLGSRFIDPVSRNGREQQPLVTNLELQRFEQKAKCCPVVCPQTVTLDAIASQVSKIIGHVDLQGQLLALEIAATQKAIWPDRFVIGKGNASPQLVDGVWHEGRTGKINRILDATQIGELRGAPDQGAARLQEQLERNARTSVGLVPQMSGESTGNMRTGRGLETLGAFSIDPRVQEAQELMGYALESVNKAVINTYTGYFASKKFNVFFGLGGSGAFAEFSNRELVESNDTKVSYAIAGADKQATTIQLGQQIGTKLISHHTARQKHPDIDDADQEEMRILEEDLDEALKISILQRASTPDAPGAIIPADMAKIRKHVRDGMKLDEAVLAVDKARQAEQAAAANQTLQPTPEEPGIGQPGLAGPAEMGAEPPMPVPPEQGPGTGISGPSGDLNNFRLLTGALRQTTRGA